MRAIAAVFAKDLRLLRRSPALLALLIGYPLLVAGIVVVVLNGAERQPPVALVNLDTGQRTVLVGEERLNVDDYVERIGDRVDLRELAADDATAALDDGRVSAVLTIPESFISDLQTGGVRQPTLRLNTSRRDAVAAEIVERELESSVFRLNQRLASGYIEQVTALVDVLVNGGRIQVFGRGGEALGLNSTRRVVLEVQAELGRLRQRAAAESLDPLVRFVEQTTANLQAAVTVAEAIKEPIVLEVAAEDEGREPLSAFGLAAALVISLGLAATLLGAAGVAAERDDGTLPRLRRGLVPGWALIGEKTALAAIVCALVGLLALVCVALGSSLAVGRWLWWPPVLLVAGLALGAAGALVGALARETRTALLIVLMAGLPLLLLGVVPDPGPLGWIAQAVPFAPAFDAFQALLIEPDPASQLGRPLIHLAALAAILGGLAAFSLVRRST